jgi:hypothetical protein
MLLNAGRQPGRMNVDRPNPVGSSRRHQGKPAFVLPAFLRYVVVAVAAIALARQADAGLFSKSPPVDAPVHVSTNDLVRILRNATNLACAAAAEKTYQKHTVFLNPKGNLKARFSFVSVFSTEYELVSKLAECLAGSTVRVRKQPDGSYLYVNASKDRFIINVIHDECDKSHFQGVYYITGDWGFATLEALLHLESKPDPDGAIKYAVNIYADSNSLTYNLFARIPFVKRYLTHEVNDVVAKFDAMYLQMLSNPRENLPKVMQCRDPGAILCFSDRDIELVKGFVNTSLLNQ